MARRADKLSSLQLEKLLRDMSAIVIRKGGIITLEDMSIELTKPQSEFQAEFYLLAELGGADFASDGSLCFSPGFEEKVKERSPWWPKMYVQSKELFLRGCRLFFGVGLLLSIVLVGVTLLLILFLIIASKKGRNETRSNVPAPFFPGGGGGGGYHRGNSFFSHLLLRELMWFSLWNNPAPIYHGGYRTHYTSNSGYIPTPQNNPLPPPPPPSDPVGQLTNETGPNESKPSILSDIFRFLFGESFNTQEDQKLRALRSVGYLIKGKRSGPVIEANEVKGYLDDYIFQYHGKQGANQGIENLKHEGFMLAVLRCFNGTTEASPDGENLYYHFPELSHHETSVHETINSFQHSAANKRKSCYQGNHQNTALLSANSHESLEEGTETPPILETKNNFFYTKQVIALGAWNIIQILILGWMLFYLDIDILIQQAQLNRSFVFSIIYITKYFYWYLFAYSIFYVLFPCFRYLRVMYLNKNIEIRNQQRIKVCNDLSAQLSRLRGDDPPFHSAVSI